MTGGDGDLVSAEALAAAERVRQRAADEMLTADALAGLTVGAARGSSEMTAAEIRRVAATAISNAQQVSYLLGRLAELTAPRDEGDGR